MSFTTKLQSEAGAFKAAADHPMFTMRCPDCGQLIIDHPDNTLGASKASGCRNDQVTAYCKLQAKGGALKSAAIPKTLLPDQMRADADRIKKARELAESTPTTIEGVIAKAGAISALHAYGRTPKQPIAPQVKASPSDREIAAQRAAGAALSHEPDTYACVRAARLKANAR